MPWGWGRGWGWRWWFWATGLPGWLRWSYVAPYWYPPYPSIKPEDELEMLEQLKADLEKELEDIKKRIDEIKKEPDE
jgi:MFS family permease